MLILALANPGMALSAPPPEDAPTPPPELSPPSDTSVPGDLPPTNSLQPEATLTPAPDFGNSTGDLPVPDAAVPLDANGHPRTGEATKPTSQESEAQALALADPLARTALQMAQTNAETLFDGVGGIPRPLSSLYLNQALGMGNGFRRGDLTLNPSVSLGANYHTTSGDHNSRDASFYGLLSPSLDLSIGEPATGRILNLEYLGSLILGPRGDRDSPYDQSFAARGVLAFTKLSLGLGLQFSQLSGGTRDTGGQDIGRELLGVSLTADYQYSPKTSFEAYVTTPIRLFSEGESSEGVTGTTFINYAYSQLTTVGVGFSGGVLYVQDGNTQTFEQLLARATYAGTGKLLYNATVGCELRQEAGREVVNPVLGIGLTYQMREGTNFTLSADRRTENSAADVDSNFVSSSVALTLTQRLGNALQAQGSVGYENANYQRVNRDLPSDNRNDDYVVVQGGVTAIFNRHLTGSIIVTYGTNQSGPDSTNFFQSLAQLTYSY